MLNKSSNSFRYGSSRNHWIPLKELYLNIPERQIKLIFLTCRKFHTDSWKLQVVEFNTEMNRWIFVMITRLLLVALYVFSFYYIKSHIK